MGKTGEFSKLVEEFHEAWDAHNQNLKTMELWELGDFLGALIRYLEKQYPGVTINDLLKQAKHTNNLFKKGLREDNDGKF